MTGPVELPIDTINLIENLMSQSYTIGHSVADLIDNSIDAGANTIDINLKIEEIEHPSHGVVESISVLIIDNGSGIRAKDLPPVLGIEKRKKGYTDIQLGAFGVGVPSSTLSQGFEVTIISKHETEKSLNQGYLSGTKILEPGNKVVHVYDSPPDWISGTTIYEHAKKKITDRQSGTAVVIQITHGSSLQMKVGDKAPPKKEQLSQKKKSLSDYLGLIFHHYLQGVKFDGYDNSKMDCKLKIIVNGAEVEPVDPLMHQYDAKIKGKRGTHFHEREAFAYVKGKQRSFSMKAACIPAGKDLPGNYGLRPKTDDEKMVNALNMLRHGTEGTVGITDCQGLYMYRNYRLIEFGSWKGMSKTVANDTCARIGIYPPIGLVVNDPRTYFDKIKDDFTTNPSKTVLEIQGDKLDEIDAFRLFSMKWHSQDPQKKSLQGRAQTRSKWDKPKGKSGGGQKPTIIADAIPKYGEVPLKVKFTASHVSGAKVKSWKWIFGKGEGSSTQQNPTHEFSKEGTYTVTVEGTAGNGKVDNQNITIDVHPKSGGIPKPKPGPKPKSKKLKFEIIDEKDLPAFSIEFDGDEQICRINSAAKEYSQLLKMIEKK